VKYTLARWNGEEFQCGEPECGSFPQGTCYWYYESGYDSILMGIFPEGDEYVIRLCHQSFYEPCVEQGWDMHEARQPGKWDCDNLNVTLESVYTGLPRCVRIPEGTCPCESTYCRYRCQLIEEEYQWHKVEMFDYCGDECVCPEPDECGPCDEDHYLHWCYPVCTETTTTTTEPPC
jgi:hypothetical protein